MPTNVKWLMDQTRLGHLRLLAGAAGVENRITGVNIMDNPDTIRWLRPGELILTTGYLFLEDAKLRNSVVAELAGRGCSGLGFVLKRYFDTLPAAMRRRANELGFPIFSIPYELSLAEVGWMVYQRIFEEGMSESERLTSLYRRLADGLAHGGGVAGMISDLVGALGRPALVLDEDFDLVGYGSAGFTGMARLFHLTEGEPAFPSHLARNVAETVRARRMTHLALPLAHEGAVVGLVLFPVYDGENILGYLCLIEDGGELAAFDYQFVETILPVLGVQLARRMINSRLQADFGRDFIRFVMSPHPHSRAEMATQCELYGFPHRPPRVAAVVRSAGRDDAGAGNGKAAPAGLETAVKAILDSLHPAYRLMPFLDNLVLFLLYPEETEDTEAWRKGEAAVEELVAGLRRSETPIVAGVSKAYRGAGSLRLSLVQALEALRFGQELDRPRDVYRYSQYQLFHLLSSALSARQARELHGETLGRLERHDRESGQDLTGTMRIFLKNSLAVSETAKELSLHRNTLFNRLERIKTLLGRDPRDLQLCLEMTVGAYAGELLRANLVERDVD